MNTLKNKSILITSGPTQEPLDPVRFLSNSSSGEMGFQLAKALKKAGARVSVVSGPTAQKFPTSIRVIPVQTAREMSKAVTKLIPKADVFIATAAVSDYRFQKVQKEKIKKTARTLQLTLVKNPDILAEAGEEKKRRKSNKPVLIGFACETGNVIKEAVNKLLKKNCDFVVGNSPASFGSNTIRPVLVEKNGAIRRFGKMKKAQLANIITKILGDHLI